MVSKSLVLFLSPLLAGLLIYLIPGGRTKNYRLLLVFAGAYLFAITVMHILPELYVQAGNVKFIGLFVLAGFFLQQILEYFTSGVEHGHMHVAHVHDDHHHHHGNGISALVLLSALCMHAFLEGSMLAQPQQMGPTYDVNAVLLGIVLHRAPAAFALMTVLSIQLGGRTKAIPHLVAFSLAAPLGLFISNYFVEQQIISETGLIWLYALVCGNFLHISTTIVFESSPEHSFNARKLSVAILGALVAVVVEYIL